MDTGVQVGFGVVGFLSLIVDLWALIALAKRPASAFDRAGKSKGFWLVTILVGIFVCNVGFFVSLWYLFMVDPKVKNMEQLGGGIGFPGP